jgi:ABC-2 type transport system ATP-binding protein
MKVVDARELVKRFGDFTAVDRVSLDIEAGTVFGFLGPNGAGKTTMIRMLCGLLTPDGGQANVLGFDLRKQTDRIKEHIGYMSQRFSLYADLTVRQNLEFYSGIYNIPNKKRKERLAFALTIADLMADADRLTSTLPGGVGAAILHEPQIVFLDEPTAGVDPVNRRLFWDLIDRLRREGTTVFVTTHYMDEAENCDRLVLIYSGRKIAEASPRALVDEVLPGAMLEASGASPDAMVKALLGQAGVQSAQVFGLAARVLVDRTADPGGELARRLAAAGLTGLQIHPVRATLEDAFIRLIEIEDERLLESGGRTR